jgi:FlaA1/EpsC-like NDP-sugar epimerase
MTRFCISLEDGVNLVFYGLENMVGGEIFIPKLPSVRVFDLADVIAPNAKKKVVGIRPGEKLHESLFCENEARNVIERDNYYIIKPEFSFWTNDEKVKSTFTDEYNSLTNTWYLNKEEIKAMLIKCGIEL